MNLEKIPKEQSLCVFSAEYPWYQKKLRRSSTHKKHSLILFVTLIFQKKCSRGVVSLLIYSDSIGCAFPGIHAGRVEEFDLSSNYLLRDLLNITL